MHVALLKLIAQAAFERLLNIDKMDILSWETSKLALVRAVASINNSLISTKFMWHRLWLNYRLNGVKELISIQARKNNDWGIRMYKFIQPKYI